MKIIVHVDQFFFKITGILLCKEGCTASPPVLPVLPVLQGDSFESRRRWVETMRYSEMGHAVSSLVNIPFITQL